MIIAKVFKDGVEIDKGICSGGKHYIEAYPEQSVTIYTDSDIWDERDYKHGDGITFKEYQDNGNGWEEVYCSVGKVNKTVEYGLPSWFINGSNMPIHRTVMDEDGDVESTLLGYMR